MQIEIKINGELAELQHILAAMATGPTSRALGVPPTEAATEKTKKAAKDEAPSVAPKTDPVKAAILEALKTEKPQATVMDAEGAVAATTEAEKPTITADAFRTIIGPKALIDRAKTKEIVAKFGYSKVSDISPVDYEAIIAELDKITA